MTAQRERTEAEQVRPERPPDREREERVNVGPSGRLASVSLGGSLVGYGLRRRGTIRGKTAAAIGGYLVYRGVSGHCLAYSALEIDTASRHRLEPGASETAVTAERSITVNAPAEELHEFWRDPERLSEIAGTYADVHRASEDSVRWTVHGPMSRTRSWKMRVVEERPGELLRWESAEAAKVPSEATVRFEPAPGDRGTEVSLRIRWDPPAGRLGAAVLERFGVVPSTVLATALRRCKSLAETGEVPTLEGNPSARGEGDRV